MASSEDFRVIFPELRRSILRSLLDGQEWGRLVDCVGSLPGWATVAGAGFEFRLGDSTPAADFIVSVVRGLPLLEYYIGRGRVAEPDSAAAALRRFLAWMADTGHTSEAPIADWFGLAMLEYDIAEAPPEDRPDPGIFLRPRLHPGPGRGFRIAALPAPWPPPSPVRSAGPTTRAIVAPWSKCSPPCLLVARWA